MAIPKIPNLNDLPFILAGPIVKGEHSSASDLTPFRPQQLFKLTLGNFEVLRRTRPGSMGGEHP